MRMLQDSIMVSISNDTVFTFDLTEDIYFFWFHRSPIVWIGHRFQKQEFDDNPIDLWPLPKSAFRIPIGTDRIQGRYWFSSRTYGFSLRLNIAEHLKLVMTFCIYERIRVFFEFFHTCFVIYSFYILFVKKENTFVNYSNQTLKKVKEKHFETKKSLDSLLTIPNSTFCRDNFRSTIKSILKVISFWSVYRFWALVLWIGHMYKHFWAAYSILRYCTHNYNYKSSINRYLNFKYLVECLAVVFKKKGESQELELAD